MGLPYSKEINAAFDQVTPLVAAGFEVLQTTKNISLMLAVIQVMTVILLLLILLALLAILISITPELDDGRRTLVVPCVKFFTDWMVTIVSWASGLMVSLVVIVTALGSMIGVLWGLYYTGRDPTLRIDDPVDDEPVEQDLEAIKRGQTEQ